MHATVTTWRLAPTLQTTEEQDRLLPELTTRAIGVAREYGILDFIMIPVSVDRLVVVSSYESEEDAIACGPPLLAFLGEQYGDTLDLISRHIGPAYEPSDFLTLDRREPRQWRDEASTMFGNINVYSIDPSVRASDAFTTFLHSISERFLSVLSKLNLLDMLVVRTGEDSMIVLRLFDDPEAFDQAIARARESFTVDPFDGKLEMIDSMRGRAFDATFLLDR